ncbi:YwhD family protein [Bacillus sp. AGMB 02131]|uniref:YwhD family protein n=1 Tax=Peribacillus faecalis TaxID=2772559 RepID=A0A927CSG6_9BACI|nr:YwhD family protein [Peribacillus faecalis]MBD3107058.1 YwhD family protein [Peribacillus faecalis]
MDNQKKKMQFNIIKNDPTDGHKGFGKGSLSLENISPIIIDVEAKEASIEIGALHARSAVERGIKFLTNKDEVPNGKPYWIVWVAIERNEEGPYYAGVTACEMTVDRSIRRGYKSLPEHVNNLDKAMKRKYITEHMDETSKIVLKEFLQSHDPSMWERSGEELKQQLS